MRSVATIADRLFPVMQGHVSIGRLTVYPVECAMHGALNLRTPWGYLCVKPSTTRYAGPRGWYVFWSPNATPWAATFAIGPGIEWRDRRAAPIRRALFGWRGTRDAAACQSVTDFIEAARDDIANGWVSTDGGSL